MQDPLIMIQDILDGLNTYNEEVISNFVAQVV